MNRVSFENITSSPSIIYGSQRLGSFNANVEVAHHEMGTSQKIPFWGTFRELGSKYYELTNLPIAIGIGNVLVVVSDRKMATAQDGTFSHYSADVVSVTDYYPFGMQMPGRVMNAGEYRFGFQGQEKDDELKGDGNSLNYTYRMHDPRIGRFFAVDPLADKYPHNSVYAFSENTPIRFVELEGLERAEPYMFHIAQAYLDNFEYRLSLDKTDPLWVDENTMIDGLKTIDLIKNLRDIVTDKYTAELVSSQDLGDFCGKTALEGVTVLYNPVGYVSYVMDLALNGSSSYGENSPTTILDPSLTTDGLQGGVDPASEIFAKSLTYTLLEDSKIRNLFADKSNYFSYGATEPWEMENLLNHVGLTSKKTNIYLGTNALDVPVLQKAVADGLIPILFENHGLTSGDRSDLTWRIFGIHYIQIDAIQINGMKINYTYREYGRIGKYASKNIYTFSASLKAYYIPVKR